MKLKLCQCEICTTLIAIFLLLAGCGQSEQQFNAEMMLKQAEHQGQVIRQFVNYQNALVESLRVVNVDSLSEQQLIAFIRHIDGQSNLIAIVGSEAPERQAGQDVRNGVAFVKKWTPNE